MALNFFLLLTLVFYQFPSLSFADAPGSLALFLDEECQEASIINPSVKLPVDTCLVNSGALGVAVQSLPPCASGNAAFVMYHDTSCTNQIQLDLQYNNCYFDGPIGIPAIMFVCSAVAGGTLATTTSTVTAGSTTIPIAANTPNSSPGGSSEQSTPSSNGATATSTSPASHTSSNSSPTSTSSSGSGSGSGLSQSTQIALGVALPIGGILVALLAWWFPCGRR